MALNVLAIEIMPPFFCLVITAVALFLFIDKSASLRKLVILLIASFILLLPSLFPAVSSILIGMGPALDAHGKPILDHQGEYVYTMQSLHNYASATYFEWSGSILGGAILIASLIHILISSAYRSIKASKPEKSNQPI